MKIGGKFLQEVLLSIGNMDKRELAWSCWIEIMHKLQETESYFQRDGHLAIKKGCGGDFVNIIVKYL